MDVPGPDGQPVAGKTHASSKAFHSSDDANILSKLKQFIGNCVDISPTVDKPPEKIVKSKFDDLPPSNRMGVISTLKSEWPKINAMKRVVETADRSLKRKTKNTSNIAFLDREWNGRRNWAPAPWFNPWDGDGMGENIVTPITTATKIALRHGVPLQPLWQPGGELFEAVSNGARHRSFADKLRDGRAALSSRLADLAARKNVNGFDEVDEDAEDSGLPLIEDQSAVKRPRTSLSPTGASFSTSSPAPEVNRGFMEVSSDREVDVSVDNLKRFQSSPMPSMIPSCASSPSPKASHSDTQALVKNMAGKTDVPEGIATSRNSKLFHDDPSSPRLLTDHHDMVFDQVEREAGHDKTQSTSTAVSVKVAVKLARDALKDRGAMLPSESLAVVIQSFRATMVIESAKIMDPLWFQVDGHQRQGHAPSGFEKALRQCQTIFIPLHHSVGCKHWTLAVMNTSSARVEHYDSMYSAERAKDTENVFTTVTGSSGSVHFRSVPTPQQKDSISCGVFMLDILNCLVHRRPVPPDIDPTSSRNKYLSLLQIQHGEKSPIHSTPRKGHAELEDLIWRGQNNITLRAPFTARPGTRSLPIDDKLTNTASTQTSAKGPFNNLPSGEPGANNSLSADLPKAYPASPRSPAIPPTTRMMETAVAEWLEANTNDDPTAHIKELKSDLADHEAELQSLQNRKTLRDSLIVSLNPTYRVLATTGSMPADQPGSLWKSEEDQRRVEKQMTHIRAAVDMAVDELTVDEEKIAGIETSIGLLRTNLENLEKKEKQFEAVEAMRNALDLVQGVFDH
ncbi:sentrin sumo-specific [Fusarium sporotrichioides]|uniref:Sentrin sumo-specific n=1 Tax=Fusarium sporotrichioides TaxID=5514 RepID=A0A395RSR8_FUSSP|nr:sentrin sumo-specific [Fusarium sporotrichioides]